jgi:hypothetical protein
MPKTLPAAIRDASIVPPAPFRKRRSAWNWSSFSMGRRLPLASALAP